LDNAIKYNNKEDKEIAVTTDEDRRGINITVATTHRHAARDPQTCVRKFLQDMKNNNARSKGLGLGFILRQKGRRRPWLENRDHQYRRRRQRFVISIPPIEQANGSPAKDPVARNHNEKR